LIASSVALPWYRDWGKYLDAENQVLSLPAAARPSTGSGLALSRQHESHVELAPESDLFVVGGVAEDVLDFSNAEHGESPDYVTDYYTAFLGPGVTILLAAGLMAVGVMVALRRAGRLTLLIGLWMALFSWAAAAGAALVGDGFSFELGGAGLRLWQAASVVAAGILGVAVVGTRPGHVPLGVTWLGVACLLAFVPFAGVLRGVEEQVPFAGGVVFGTYALLLGVPAAGVVIGLDSVRSQPYLLAQRVPAAVALALGVLLWGWLVITLVS